MRRGLISRLFYSILLGGDGATRTLVGDVAQKAVRPSSCIGDTGIRAGSPPGVRTSVNIDIMSSDEDGTTRTPCNETDRLNCGETRKRGSARPSSCRRSHW